ncbi:MAG TPA: cell division protein ZapA [Candidatus Limnocylindrales bacterium]|nr:cell division protein ZapA [Candidatus Limnocylindrales bacterium]
MGESFEINKVTVTIMGEEYTLKGNSTPETMQQVSRYVDRLMKMLAENNTQMSKHKIAVLAAINLADELFKLKQVSGEIRGKDDDKELV